MHYKTRTYLNEAVILRSTGCDMNEVWSMYATFGFCCVTRRDVICDSSCLTLRAESRFDSRRTQFRAILCLCNNKDMYN